jgi:hypothetical protein
LEVQKNAQIKANTTFVNLKGTIIFRVTAETFKEMKRLQNPRMVDRNDRNDMEDMKHQGADIEDCVLTTFKTILTRKNKK